MTTKKTTVKKEVKDPTLVLAEAVLVAALMTRGAPLEGALANAKHIVERITE